MNTTEGHHTGSVESWHLASNFVLGDRRAYSRGDGTPTVADFIWLESPSNPLLTVGDIDAICAAPRKHGAVLGVDNTFATPLNQQPLLLGADVAVQSVTKFIGGHSDLLCGVATVRDPNLLAALRHSRELTGGTPGPIQTKESSFERATDAGSTSYPVEVRNNRMAGSVSD